MVPEDLATTASPASLQSCQEALAILQKLVEEYPTWPAYQSDLGWAYIHLGHWSRDDKRSYDGASHYRKARDLFKKLVEDKPKNLECRNNLAYAHYNFGTALQDVRFALPALTAHQEALPLREQLVKEAPGDEGYERELTEVHNSLGMSTLSLRRYEEALAWFAKTETGFRALAENTRRTPSSAAIGAARYSTKASRSRR